MAIKKPLVISGGMIEQLQLGDVIDIPASVVQSGDGYVNILTSLSDSLYSGSSGDARGIYAVDFQTYRSLDTQVASGEVSFIGGGRDNTASGQYSVVTGGCGNTAESTASGVFCGKDNVVASSTYSPYSCVLSGYNNEINTSGCSVICGGDSNAISASDTNGYSFIGSGRKNEVSGLYASIACGYYGKATRYGQSTLSSGRFDLAGDAQTSTLVARLQTDSATPGELFLDGTSVRLIVPEGATYGFTIKVVARQTNDDFSVARYVFEGVATRDTGGNVYVQVTKTYEYEDDSDWGCAVDADTANQTIRITVTGKAGNDINWVARVELEETFA
jgi:hypothetical protein